MLSYWEKKNFINYDFIVVGAGIVGLSTAIHLKVKFPKKSVLVLERGIFPSGASSRNAGFACFGSLTEILDDLYHMDEDEVLELVARRFSGLSEIREVFGDHELGYESLGGYEMFREEDHRSLEKIYLVNSLLKDLFGEDVFHMEKNVKKFGFSPAVKAVVRNDLEGQLDSGKFLKALWRKCHSLDVQLLTGAEVTGIDRENGIVKVDNPVYSSQIEFFGQKIAICTNAFTKQLLPEIDMKPGRGTVLVSEPIPGLAWKGAFHFDKGYTYFRNVEDRLLIGGGRNMAFEDEETDIFGVNQVIKDYLVKLTNEVIFPGQSVKFEMEWSGIMAFGSNKTPVVQKLDECTGVAIRMGGMGVAIGWQAAKELVNLFEKA
ncbi:FAD-binding oxidoreductase [Litoribacter alkaliphilus]|uniref:FAD-binding oxidoreductase n=1 Tax=Litoribacter ruber TaxID=702568 RepID=A0AAP2CGU2_9BACT|nr:FAD-dependent oxidoreductase [Litoribacter alkaliphilus]MBS9522941.1 FAD-binding oxidoreductase [Litoribacter alkaliphilus]